MQSRMMVGVVGLMCLLAAGACKHSKKSEWAASFDKIGDAAMAYYNAHRAFPIGSTPRTPARSCCEQSFEGKFRCAPDPAAFATPAWTALPFRPDEPRYFQYTYESVDGTSFVFSAIGDLDCDGTEIVFRLHGAVRNGVPELTLEQPAPNSD